ncbi:MAG TPA: serine/threonine-protein kinase [Kofleriaceae bacterium]
MLDRIAVGGMAEVFLAKAYGSHGFEKTLAIKRILPELARDPEFEARFIAEAKVAVRLSHANVVQVLDFGRIGESLFIAMEYVDGLDLAAMLRRFKDEKRQIPLPAAFHIAIEIIRALDFAHAHNVVHRDVSPSNVLISRAGEVKLADFGIAVAATPNRDAGPGMRRVMGKWRYMSPEQTRGDLLDTRSDMFSAASVLYELFTGDKLFPGDEAKDIIENIQNMTIPRMQTLRPGLPSRLDDVLAPALARKPIDRPTRPATVLRQLIELSYESSIMATALDVAEAVATVVPATLLSGRGALDDVIRKQLAEQSIARQTAVTDKPPPQTEKGEHSTGLFRLVDSDGISRLDEVGVDEDTRVRQTAPLEKADMHALLEVRDPDRHTEVGSPPTGSVPRVDGTGAAKAIAPPVAPAGAPPVPPARRRWILVAAAGGVVALGGGGYGIYRASRITVALPPAPPVVLMPDAPPPAPVDGILAIDPDPDGTLGTITAAGSTSVLKEFGPTVRGKGVKLRVTPNVDLVVHFSHAGYRSHDLPVNVPPGQTYILRPSLLAAPARLHVVTNPPGATVSLGGRMLGTTPLALDDLAPAKDAVLALAHPGYESSTAKVSLVAGEQAEVSQTLKASAKLGAVRIVVTGAAGWGHVFFKGKDLGRNNDGMTLMVFALPAGPQALRITNGALEKVVTVNVPEGDTATFTVTM